MRITTHQRNPQHVFKRCNDIANDLGGFEVTFDVGAVGVGRVGYLMHLGSVVQALCRRKKHPTGRFKGDVFAGCRESFEQTNRLYEHGTVAARARRVVA